MSTDSLNFLGQVVLTGSASIAVNGVSHPLGTIETCMQVREPIPWRGLYRGITAICSVEAASFAIAYVSNDALKSQLGPIGAIFAAAAISTPVIGIGEGAMKNRQANNLAYRSRELWQRSVRISGLYMTFYRETFWNLGIFYATPQMSAAMQRQWPGSNPWVQQVAAATITGCAIGFVTTPIAGIKTVIQASPENLSIFQAIQKINRSQRPVLATQQLWAGACSRMGYLSVGMCIMNLVYQHLPSYLPHSLKHQ